MQLLQTLEEDALDDSGIGETASASTASASGQPPDKERLAGRLVTPDARLACRKNARRDLFLPQSSRSGLDTLFVSVFRVTHGLRRRSLGYWWVVG